MRASVYALHGTLSTNVIARFPAEQLRSFAKVTSFIVCASKQQGVYKQGKRISFILGGQVN